MANVISPGVIVCSTPAQVNRFRLISIKMQLKLEKSGLKSSGGPLRPRLAAEFNLKPRAHHDDYIAAIQAILDVDYRNTVIKAILDLGVHNASGTSAVDEDIINVFLTLYPIKANMKNESVNTRVVHFVKWIRGDFS